MKHKLENRFIGQQCMAARLALMPTVVEILGRRGPVFPGFFRHLAWSTAEWKDLHRVKRGMRYATGGQGNKSQN